ncbi:MAG: putative glycosyl transferase [Pelotomaculum sp. PtaB.Bin013]|nr:MAG: putative glycosyl transferase [Pelotomaculum sp. PtaB.Bin013]
MPRVIMVVNSDYRYDARVQKEAAALGMAGYSVTVFSLAMDVRREQNVMGVRVLNPTTGKMAWFPYKLSYLKAYWQIIRALLREKADVWHGHDLDMLPFVFIAAKLKGGKLVYDSHELWQGYDWPSRGGRRGLLRRLLWQGWLWLEKALAKHCHLIITVNESCAREIARRLEVRPPLALRNCVDPAETASPAGSLRETLGLGHSELLVVYTGKLQKGRGLEELLKAWAGLPADRHLAIIGQGPLEGSLRDFALSAGLNNVFFLPPVEALELPGYIRGATLGVVLIEDTDQSKRYSLPNKLLEYIAAGVPVLASKLPEISRLVDEYQIGVFADPGDSGRIRKSLSELLGNAGKLRFLRLNTLKARVSLTWRKEAGLLISEYSKITKGGKQEASPLAQGGK